jgi:O-acetyl-ADP-ribose deacetylase (regulator of RNase III)
MAPGTLRFVEGDATAPSAAGNKIVAHVCNDIGGWGAGFVLAVSRRWPGPEADYRSWHAARATNDFRLGAVRLVAVDSNVWVANMVAQRDIRRRAGVPPIRYDAVEACLVALSSRARDLEASVHMPRIGCGLAGGTWDRIEPLVRRALVEGGVDVTVYDLPQRPRPPRSHA